LNWRAPGVEDAQFAMVRGWLARGVDGFRLDTFNVLLKHPDTPPNPSLHGTSPWDRQEHRYDLDQPDLPALIQRFQAIVDQAGGRMSVGEMFVGTTEGAARAPTRSGRPSSAVNGRLAVGGRRSSCPTTTSRDTPRDSQPPSVQRTPISTRSPRRPRCSS
jgi:alpha-glucosidase